MIDCVWSGGGEVGGMGLVRGFVYDYCNGIVILL
jgi:hypothetical protein